MNKNLKIALAIAFAIIFMVFIGCEGPRGPAGVAGADGADGTDLTDEACLTCHVDDVLYEKRYELNQEAMATMANSLSRGGRAGCGACHSHENFVSYVEEGETADLETVTGLTCKSCHPLHNSDAADDFSFALRGDAEVEYLTGDIGTFGSDSPSNICLYCHSPRRGYSDYDDTPDDATDSVSMTSSHSGPHYSVTGSLIFGEGADDRNGTVDLDQGPMQHAVAGCVACHMGDESNHTFAPDEASCESCHGTTANFDIHGAPTKMEDAIHALELKFVTLGALEDDGDGGFDQTASRGTPTVLTGVQFSAFWNYLVLHSDHGHLYHNPPYVKAMINNMEENLGMTQTTW